MERLFDAAVRALTAVAVYYEKQAGQESLPLAAQPPVEIAPRVRKPRAPKAEAPVDPAPAAKPEAAAAQPPAAKAELTEADSLKQAGDLANAVMRRYDKPTGEMLPNGQPKTEGFLKLKAMLAEKFKVARFADLVHAQRVDFIKECEALLAAAPAPATAAADLGV